MKAKASFNNFLPAYAAKIVTEALALDWYKAETYEEFAEIAQQHFDLTPEQWEAVLNEWETLQVARTINR